MKPLRFTATAAGTIPIMGCLLAVLGAQPVRAQDPATIGWRREPIATAAASVPGYVEYQNSCVVCHGAMPERPGTRALAAKYHGALPAVLEDRTNLAPDYIRYVVRHGVSVMPPFRKTEVTDRQLDAIVAYLTRPRTPAAK